MGSEKDREEESLSMILTAEIVSAYVSANTIPHDSIGKFILNVRSALTQSNNSVQEIDCALQEPAVSPKKSVHQDFLICLEDGKKFKSLKRHLMTHHGMTPRVPHKVEFADRLPDGCADLFRKAHTIGA